MATASVARMIPSDTTMSISKKGSPSIFAFGDHPDAGHDEQRAEDVQDPVERGDQDRARADKQPTHDQRAENAVEQHAVLAHLRDAKVLEDENDDEDVVDAERLFDDVS